MATITRWSSHVCSPRLPVLRNQIFAPVSRLLKFSHCSGYLGNESTDVSIKIQTLIVSYVCHQLHSGYKMIAFVKHPEKLANVNIDREEIIINCNANTCTFPEKPSWKSTVQTLCVHLSFFSSGHPRHWLYAGTALADQKSRLEWYWTLKALSHCYKELQIDTREKSINVLGFEKW